jgi:hypothetical protein
MTKKIHRISVKMTSTQRRDLCEMASHYGCSKAEILRRALKWCQSIRFEYGHIDVVSGWGKPPESGEQMKTESFRLRQKDYERMWSLWASQTYEPSVKVRSCLRAYRSHVYDKCHTISTKNQHAQIW